MSNRRSYSSVITEDFLISFYVIFIGQNSAFSFSLLKSEIFVFLFYPISGFVASITPFGYFLLLWFLVDVLLLPNNLDSGDPLIKTVILFSCNLVKVGIF